MVYIYIEVNNYIIGCPNQIIENNNYCESTHLEYE